MKSKNAKKISLNKRSISSFAQEEVKGGRTTIITPIDTKTFQSSYCANTRDDYSCQCTVA